MLSDRTPTSCSVSMKRSLPLLRNTPPPTERSTQQDTHTSKRKAHTVSVVEEKIISTFLTSLSFFPETSDVKQQKSWQLTSNDETMCTSVRIFLDRVAVTNKETSRLSNQVTVSSFASSSVLRFSKGNKVF